RPLCGIPSTPERSTLTVVDVDCLCLPLRTTLSAIATAATASAPPATSSIVRRETPEPLAVERGRGAFGFGLGFAATLRVCLRALRRAPLCRSRACERSDALPKERRELESVTAAGGGHDDTAVRFEDEALVRGVGVDACVDAHRRGVRVRE